jgi:integrase
MHLAKRRFLPEYVTSFKDRHGKERLRFRRKGFPAGYFKAALGTEDFRIEYRAFMSGAEDPVAVAIERTVPGSINDLVTRYFATPSRLGPSATTQSKVRRIIGNFRDEYGALPAARVTFEHIDKIIGKKLERRMEQTAKGLRPVGGPEAARKLRKELVRLFDFAVKLGMVPTNPVTHSDRVKVEAGKRSKGAHTWTEVEIAQYREHHALGSKARLAMELMLWTGQRRIDAIRMGRQHIVNGRIKVTQSKGGTELWIPVAPSLLESIVAMPTSQKGHLCFLLTDYGKPFTNPGFGNWFREQCDAAGLPQCSAHGLRKAMMRRLAELHLGNQSLKSVSGHVNDAEVAVYTREVDQRTMADHAISALAAWEKSNLRLRLDTNTAENG